MLGKVAIASAACFLAVAFGGAALVVDDAGDDGGQDDEPDMLCQATASIDGLDAEQRRVATRVLDAGEDAGVPRRGLVIALAAAAVESRLRNLPYGDRDSVGVFQQRPSTGWGSLEELMNVSYAAGAFFGGPTGPNSYGSTSEPPGLLDIAGWQRMPVGDAAQAVQRSAYPDRYADWEDDARTWLAELTGQGARCEASLPLEKGVYRLTSKYGYREHPLTGQWQLHDGLDFAAPAGTTVVAVSAGEVTSVGFRPWAGPHLVEIDHGDRHTSEYGHMASSTVARGDMVRAGQKIGTVGNEGLSTGPHLHLTIRERGKPMDPMNWFVTHGLAP